MCVSLTTFPPSTIASKARMENGAVLAEHHHDVRVITCLCNPICREKGQGKQPTTGQTLISFVILLAQAPGIALKETTDIVPILTTNG